jgi:hypothetical protein
LYRIVKSIGLATIFWISGCCQEERRKDRPIPVMTYPFTSSSSESPGHPSQNGLIFMINI